MMPPKGVDIYRLHYSIISETGSNTTSGQKFWIYYVTAKDWNIHIWRRKITLSLATPKVGDANGDSKVDVFDFKIWAPNYVQSENASIGNFTQTDSKVNALDFALWVKNAGS